MTLLSINAGSSSLKVAVFDDDSLDAPRTSVSIEGIGTPNACLIPEGAFGSDGTRKLPIDTPEDAARYAKEWIADELGITSDDIVGIGHRVVHGGERFKHATRVNDEVIDYLESITPLAPNHMPATVASIKAFVTAYPGVDHVACFDTSFFHDLPKVAQTLPIDKAIRDTYGIRRFGFHGLSYQFLLDSFTQNEGEEAASGKIIMAHLGNGASVTACENGQPVDTSMGFTPVSGIMMSTRTGDIEPGVVTYLQKYANMSADDVAKLMSHQSGLLGVSGKTADMYTLLQSEATDEDAALAIELFCYKITKQIGAYAAVLGGVDSILFSGGIGERSAPIRQRILERLSFLGIELDEGRNQNGERLISSDASRVGVHVIPAREDVMIIRQTLNITTKGA